MQVSDSRLPYQQKSLQRRLEVAPRLVLSTADSYVSAATLSGSGVLPQLIPTTPHLGTFFALGSGVLAVSHAVAGFRTLTEDAPYGESKKALNLRRLQGAADLLAAAGLAGQAFGLGPWTAALAVVGSLTATTTSCLRRTGA